MLLSIPLVIGVILMILSLLSTHPEKNEEGSDLEILKSHHAYCTHQINRNIVMGVGVILISLSLLGYVVLMQFNQLLIALQHI